ncbi:MAG: hypothetical protein ACJ796_09350 [Gemmatimonadaceae bacterium]
MSVIAVVRGRDGGLLYPARTEETIVTVSVDTEEDNWVPARTGITLGNIRELPRLDRWFGTLGVRPTYFTTYQVGVNARAAEILRDIMATGRSEIGAHLHPWNTPPLDEPFEPWLTMTENLTPALREAKINRLTDLLASALGRAPTTFRAGRFGLGSKAAASLVRCGYQVDSSMTPFVDWRSYDGGPSHEYAPMAMHWLGADGRRCSSAEGRLIEMPISLGYTRAPFELWHRVHRAMSSRLVRPLRIVGATSRLRLLEKVILNPENDDTRSMVALARQLIARGTGYLHFFFHSPSLIGGASPYAPTRAAAQGILATLEETLDRIHALTRVRFMTVAEAVASMAPEFTSTVRGQAAGVPTTPETQVSVRARV